jgi:lysophospholipase L1-like esterase
VTGGVWRRIWKGIANAGIAAASLVAMLIVLELGVRLFVPEPLWRFREGSQDWTSDPEIGWVNRPAIDVESLSAQGMIHFQTNSDGLIPVGARRERTPGVLRIMIFGDSMVVGRDVPQSQNYSVRLEAILRERGIPVEVINAGVLGYSTDQALLLMQRYVPRYRPDLVIFGSTSNDFGGNSLRFAYAQSKATFHLDRDARLRYTAPTGEKGEKKSGLRYWIQNFALYRVLQPRIYQLRSRLGDWQERLLHGVMDEVYYEPRAADQVDWPLFSALVARMQEVSRENGADFVLIAHPEVGEVWDPYVEKTCEERGWPCERYDRFALERRVAEAAARAGVPFVPLIAEFAERQERGPFHLLPRDGHLNAAGHQLLAERLAEHLSARLAAMRR